MSCTGARAGGSKPFVKVNAAALPSELLESELFGHERGAFTGAQSARIGKFEFANHGTLMLDEIGEMPAGLQAKLLHVLQDSEFTKLGSNRPITVDVRIIAATNRDLDSMMRAGSFREDLYYRLQVIELHVPPLRERREEIPQLVEFFLVKYSERYGRPLRRPSETLREALSNYSWPGNVRELENVIKRFVILQDEALVLAELKRVRTQIESSAHTARPAAAAAAPVAAAPPPSTRPRRRLQPRHRRFLNQRRCSAAPAVRRRKTTTTLRNRCCRQDRSASPSWPAKPPCAPSASPSSRRSIASGGIGARRPIISASATRRSSTK